MKPTAAELAYLRDRPHQTKLYLSIYQPQTVLACRTTGSPVRGERVISYNTVTAGSYLSVENGMTMYVGSSAGASDLGRIRVRSATNSTITVAENSDIPWANSLYLTVVRYFEIWPIYPRLVQDGEDVTFYKDYDIAYDNLVADQNANLGLFICMGPHSMAMRNPATGNGIGIYYSASGTYSLMERTPLTYDWAFEGGTPTGSSANTPGWVAYYTPGHYTTRLRVTDSDGFSDVSYRHISIYDRPENGDSPPILNWGLNSLEGSREEGGYTASLWVRGEVDYLVDGMLVVIGADDWYGANYRSVVAIGGNALNHATDSVFVGYIVAGSIMHNYRDSSVTFEVRSPTGIMEMMEGFSVSVENRTGVSQWWQLKRMTVRKALYHYMRWHSTILMCNDFEFVGNDQQIEYFDADRTSLYDAMQTLMDGTLVGAVVSDRQGKIWAEIDVSATTGSATVFQTSMELSNVDWMNEPQIEERNIPELSYLEMGGIKCDIDLPKKAGRMTPFMAASPGSAPGYRGSAERTQGLAVSSQDQLNYLVGSIYAHRNARYPELTLDMAGNYRNFDIAPQELVKVSLAANDTPRGIVWNNKPFAVRGMSWYYDPRGGLFLPTLYAAEVVEGIAAETISIPEEPPDDGFLEPPPLPPLPEPPIISTGGSFPIFVLPATGYNQTTFTYDTWGESYIDMLNNNAIAAAASFRVPSTYSGNMTIVGLISGPSGVSGTMQLRHQIYKAALGERDWNTSVGDTTQVGVSVSGQNLQILASLSFSATGGDFVFMRLKRYGDDVNDTYGGTIRFHGWLVTYG